MFVVVCFSLKLQIDQGEVTNKSGDKVMTSVTSYWEEEVPDEIKTEVEGQISLDIIVIPCHAIVKYNICILSQVTTCSSLLAEISFGNIITC